jgi:hypothetical protein
MSNVVTVISIDSEGNLSWVKSPAMAGLMGSGETTVKRASNIEPVNPVVRAIFKLIRSHVNDNHALSCWTRKWPVCWRVNLGLSNGPTFGSFRNRQDAIEAEVAWLRIHVFRFQG